VPRDPGVMMDASALEGVLHLAVEEQATPPAGGRWRGTVYLIHFADALHHAQHYLGWTAGHLDRRLVLHGTSRGARIMQVITDLGIEWWLVRTWENAGPDVEHALKAWHNGRRFCPLCDPQAYAHKPEEDVGG
jgi:hypothetical protein